MKQGKTRLFCAAEHFLPVGVVLLALFWVIRFLLETLFSGDVALLRCCYRPSRSSQRLQSRRRDHLRHQVGYLCADGQQHETHRGCDQGAH